MLDFVHAMKYWFQNYNLKTESLTVILNFTAADEAASFDSVIRAEISEQPLFPNEFILDTNRFEIHGIKLKIESPLHPI